MRNILLAALRWVLVLPASFFASWAAAWLFGLVTRLQYSSNVVEAPTLVEQTFYSVAAAVVYGWVFVSAGAATAPGRRSIVAVVLACVLVAVMGYLVYHGALSIEGFIAAMWAALHITGYVGGAAIAVWMAVIENRNVKTSA